MIDFTNKTYRNILSEQLARVPNTIDKRELSLIQTALGPASWYLEGLFMLLAQLQRNGFALTATGDALDLKAAERGVSRNIATPAIRAGVFNVEPNIGDRFSTINGVNSLNFFVSNQMGLEADGLYHCELTCETPGSEGNNYTGNLLPITFIAGLTSAVMTDIIIPGTNEQDDEGLRQKYLDSLLAESFAGNIAYYRDIIKNQDNITGVQVYPIWNGGGTVMCSILDGNYNAATPALIELIQNFVCPLNPSTSNPTEYGLGKAPIGAQVTIGTPAEFPIAITATVELISGFTIPAVQQRVEDVINEYFLQIRREWDRITVSNGSVMYLVNVFASRINSALMSIEEVVNVTNITLNGSAADLILTQTGALNQIPTLSGVTLSES
jgi:uncharacterized phage protein gp47/JayE